MNPNDEIRAAAKEILDAAADMKWGDTAKESRLGNACLRNGLVLARHVQAMHDPAPITEEWLRACGFEHVGYIAMHGNWPILQLKFLSWKCCSVVTGDYIDTKPNYLLYVGTTAVRVSTRGQFRQLCSALGVELRGEGGK